jgi:hypothetical protein
MHAVSRFEPVRLLRGVIVILELPARLLRPPPAAAFVPRA